MAEPFAPAPARKASWLEDRPFVESGWVVSLNEKLAVYRARMLGGRLRYRVIEALRRRDGDGCCFGPWCLFEGRPLDFTVPARDLPYHERPSIEHRAPWYKHHSHRLEHLALAHTRCNQWAGCLQWAYIQREERLARKAPRIPITAWPALTYADELEFD